MFARKKKVFLTILLDDRRIRSRIREAQKHSDPDPQHWIKVANHLQIIVVVPGQYVGYDLGRIRVPNQK
jgi:hypothetical protein